MDSKFCYDIIAHFQETLHVFKKHYGDEEYNQLSEEFDKEIWGMKYHFDNLEKNVEAKCRGIERKYIKMISEMADKDTEEQLIQANEGKGD